MPTGDPPPRSYHASPYAPYSYDPVFAPYELGGGVTFMSGTMEGFGFLSTGTVPGAAFPSGYHGGVSVIDDPISVNENPPFPGWDPVTQVVRLTDESGLTAVAAGYHSLAICDDLELDAEDFSMRSAEVTTDPTIAVALGKPSMMTGIEKALREAARMSELSDEIERLRAAVRRLELEKIRAEESARPTPGVVSPNPWETEPPYIKGMWPRKEKRPIVKPEGWSRDTVFGPEAGGVAPLESLEAELRGYPPSAHADNVDASRMLLSKVRKAIGMGFGVGR